MAEVNELITRLTAKVDGLLSGLDVSNRAVRNFTQQSESSIGSLKKGWVEFTAATVGARLAVDKLWESGRRGAEFEETLGRLDRQARTFGATADYLTSRLQRAAEGQLSLAKSSELASRGLAIGANIDQLETFARAADALGDVLGTDLPTAYEQLLDVITSGRSRILANIGVYIDLDEAVKELASSTNRQAEAVTKQERAMLVANAIAQQGESAMKKLGDAALSDADKFAVLTARWEDFKLSLSRGAKDLVLAGADTFDPEKGLLRSFNPEYFLKSWQGYQRSVKAITDELFTYADPAHQAQQMKAGQEILQRLLGEQIVQETKLAVVKRDVAAAAAEEAKGLKIVGDALRTYRTILSDVAREGAGKGVLYNLTTGAEITRKNIMERGLAGNAPLTPQDLRTLAATPEGIVGGNALQTLLGQNYVRYYSQQWAARENREANQVSAGRAGMFSALEQHNDALQREANLIANVLPLLQQDAEAAEQREAINKAVIEATDELNRSMNEIAVRQDVLGREYDATSAKIQAAQQTLIALRNEGIDPASEGFQRIQQTLDRLKDMQRFEQAIDRAFSSITSTFDSVVQGVLLGTQTLRQAVARLGVDLAASLTKDLFVKPLADELGAFLKQSFASAIAGGGGSSLAQSASSFLSGAVGNTVLLGSAGVAGIAGSVSYGQAYSSPIGPTVITGEPLYSNNVTQISGKDMLGYGGAALAVGFGIYQATQAQGDKERAKAFGQVAGTIAGGAIGAAVGGPLGALVGATIGGFAGNMAGGGMAKANALRVGAMGAFGILGGPLFSEMILGDVFDVWGDKEKSRKRNEIDFIHGTQQAVKDLIGQALSLKTPASVMSLLANADLPGEHGGSFGRIAAAFPNGFFGGAKVNFESYGQFQYLRSTLDGEVDGFQQSVTDAVNALIRVFREQNYKINTQLMDIARETIRLTAPELGQGSGAAFLAQRMQMNAAIQREIDAAHVDMLELTDPAALQNQVAKIRDLLKSRYEGEIQIVQDWSSKMQTAVAAWRALNGSVTDQLDLLRLNQYGAPGAEDAFTFAQRRFDKALTAFRGNKTAELGAKVSDLAQPLLSAASDLYGGPTSASYQRVFSTVISALEQVQTEAQAAERTFNEAMLAALGQSQTLEQLIADNTARMAASLEALRLEAAGQFRGLGFEIPKFAEGGYVDRPTLALVGERGPEYIVPANRLPAAAGSRSITLPGAVFIGTEQAMLRQFARLIKPYLDDNPSL